MHSKFKKIKKQNVKKIPDDKFAKGEYFEKCNKFSTLALSAKKQKSILLNVLKML